MSKDEQIDRAKYHLAYGVIGPVIENCIRANKGEDGLVLVDYAELRDALAGALVDWKRTIDKEARIDEQERTELYEYDDGHKAIRVRHSEGLWLPQDEHIASLVTNHSGEQQKHVDRGPNFVHNDPVSQCGC